MLKTLAPTPAISTVAVEEYEGSKSRTERKKNRKGRGFGLATPLFSFAVILFYDNSSSKPFLFYPLHILCVIWKKHGGCSRFCFPCPSRFPAACRANDIQPSPLLRSIPFSFLFEYSKYLGFLPTRSSLLLPFFLL